jgi:hypothetical protein
MTSALDEIVDASPNRILAAMFFDDPLTEITQCLVSSTALNVWESCCCTLPFDFGQGLSLDLITAQAARPSDTPE